MAKSRTGTPAPKAPKEAATQPQLMIMVDAELPKVQRVKIDDIESAGVVPDDEFVRSVRASNGAEKPIVLVTAGNRGYTIIDGKRRVAAHTMLRDEHARFAEIDARIYDAGKLPMVQRHALTIRLNHHRSANPIAELDAIDGMRKAGITDTKDIARALGIGLRQVQRILQLDKLAPELRTAMMQGRMTFDTGIKASRLPAKDQKRLIKAAEKDGDDGPGIISGADVHALLERGPAKGLDKLFGDTAVEADVTTRTASLIAELEQLAAKHPDTAAHFNAAIVALGKIVNA
jgi:ParB-like chromosome segregation protein Spo0J